jgi:hypothetical protein
LDAELIIGIRASLQTGKKVETMAAAPSEAVAPEPKQAISKEEVEIRARNIMRNVRCLTCPNQNVEDAQTNIAILLRNVSSSLKLLLAVFWLHQVAKFQHLSVSLFCPS